MKRTTKYVGLDVHQATTVIAVLDERGRLIARSIVATTADALVDFCRGMRGTIRVVFEEGTQAQWLHDVLVPVVTEVVVCNRRGDGQQGSKGDLADAEELANRLRWGGLRPVYHGGSSQNLKELARSYQTVLEDSTRTMQRLKAMFRARGIRTPGQRVYHPAERATWLAQLSQPGARLRAEALYAELETLQAWRPPDLRRAPRGSEAGSRVARAAHDSVSRADSGRAVARDAANAVALSHQAPALGVCGLGGRDTRERGI